MKYPSATRGNVAAVSLFAIVIVTGLVLAAVIYLSNASNVRATAGYACYTYTKPIFGQSSYAGVVFGPGSTGLKWRRFGQTVSITPYTYSEAFTGENAVLAKDKLPLSSQVHIVWRLRPDEKEVKRFMEEYGGWDSHGDPDEIAKQAYAQFIQEPFRTITRAVLAGYNGLDVNESLKIISDNIQTQMKENLAHTPFEVISVVMGNASPPKQVIDAIAAKVALNQMLEQKVIEDQIAAKNIEIERKNGSASGSKAFAEAIERTKAIASISAALTPAYIQYLAAENIRGAERVYVPLSGGPQLVIPANK